MGFDLFDASRSSPGWMKGASRFRSMRADWDWIAKARFAILGEESAG